VPMTTVVATSSTPIRRNIDSILPRARELSQIDLTIRPVLT
jgi:hypothetical protein